MYGMIESLPINKKKSVFVARSGCARVPPVLSAVIRKVAALSKRSEKRKGTVGARSRRSGDEEVDRRPI